MDLLKKCVAIFLVLIFVAHSNLLAQNKLQVYLFPGQGSDYRLFDSLSWPVNVDTTIISYGTPGEGMSMQAFAKSLLSKIDTTEQFALIGVSLGGMICVELSELIKPELTIIISSAKNNRELYQFMF
jgi:surfactin synthase thioesterase subunit